ncbi:MAG: transglutaminase family protein [Candidatus Taylorbacteria bacterium]
MKDYNLQQFLLPTYYCDSDNDLVKDIARKYVDQGLDEAELARRLFYYVRDSTVYRVGHWTRKASETLLEKGGTCTNNANLLVALLRAAKIPAGYGVMDVVGPEYFGPVVLPHFSRNVSRRSKHVYCYVYVKDKWVKCDPSDDEPLSINTQHLNPQSRVVEWNGLSDAMLNLDPNHILKDDGPLSSIDNVIAKKMKHRRRIPVYLGNIYIQFLREEGRNILKLSELNDAFNRWLFQNHKVLYIFYRLFFFIESTVNRMREYSRSTFIKNNKYA